MKGVLVAVADTGTPPATYLDGNNELVGFDIDVARDLARRLGMKAEFFTPAWDVITAGHWEMRWDIAITSMTPTKERAKVLDFPVVYYAIPAVLAVNKANKSITRAEDASGSASVP